MPKPKFCPECELEFEVTHEETRAFFPVMYCPFCGVDIFEEEVVEELDFDENDEQI